MKSAFLILWFALACASGAMAQTTTRVRILPEFVGVTPGQSVPVVIELQMAPGWHTYWRTPGDAGQATKVAWNLPEGITAGPLEWPTPERIDEESLTVFAYHGTVRLISVLNLSPNVPPGEIEVTAKVSWLECQKSCIKGTSLVPIKLSVGSQLIRGADTELVAAARARIPLRFSEPLTATWGPLPLDGDERVATVVVPEGTGTELLLDRVPDGQWSARVPDRAAGGFRTFEARFTRFEKAWPRQVTGLLVRTGADGSREGYEFAADLAETTTGSPMSQVSVAVSPKGKGDGVEATVSGGTSSFGSMLAAAFLGGLILNIMPCVLPVIALKILGFVGQANEHPGRVRAMGMLYGAGVLASFLALALLVIGVKSAGGTASWGMQFQNPRFLLVTTAIVLLVALNLFGIFEVILPGAAMQSASELAGKEGLGGAFFNGVLATLLATPCTAPFLGVSLGFALSQSPGTIVLFFLTAGAGLAFPYVLLCWQPAWLRFLPRPGNWMVSFKMAMGFPVLATGVWLFTLTTPHFGNDRAFWVGMFLVAVSLGSWIFGHFIQRSRKSSVGGWIALLLVAGVGYGWFLEGELDWRHLQGRSRSSAAHVGPSGPIAWGAWSPEAVVALRKQGRPVLVDFTADWCTTCQINKRRAIEVEPVVRRIAELQVASLLGDFTFEDPAIAAELKRHRRAGVPLVLVYPADLRRDPIVLPDGLISSSDLMTALESAVQTR